MNSINNKIKELFELLHPLNYMILESPVGDDWVRIKSYSCVPLDDEEDCFKDYKSQKILKLIESCEDGVDVEDMMLVLSGYMPPPNTKMSKWVEACRDAENETSLLDVLAPSPKKSKIKIEWCNLCETYFIRCPKCGNNCCNATFGEDGKCDVCPTIYDYQDKLWAVMHELHEKLGMKES